MLAEVTKAQDNVRVARFDGLVVDFCRANNVSAIVKGLRAVSDFDYEMQMAQMNYSQAGVETLFMTTNPLYAFLSSSLVKEFAKYGGDVSGLVPEQVIDRLTSRRPGAVGTPRRCTGNRTSWDSRRQAGKLSGQCHATPAVCHASSAIQAPEANRSGGSACLRHPDPRTWNSAH